VPTHIGPRHLFGTAHVLDWIAATPDPARREALLRWLGLVCKHPHSFTSDIYVDAARPGAQVRGRADVPIARTRVTFIVGDYSVRHVRIMNMDNASYRPE
jgi:hypothetical protein